MASFHLVSVVEVMVQPLEVEEQLERLEVDEQRSKFQNNSNIRAFVTTVLAGDTRGGVARAGEALGGVAAFVVGADLTGDAPVF